MREHQSPYPYGQSFSSVRDSGSFAARKSSPRLKGFDYTGAYGYLITRNTADRQKRFTSPALVDSCLGRLSDLTERHSFEVFAYCFMPDHLHLLLQGTSENSRLDRFMQQFKQITSYHFKQQAGASLWHRSYHDRVLRHEEALSDVANYIWHNPVRAGLMHSREDYPFSGPRERILDRPEGLSLRASADERIVDRPEGLSLCGSADERILDRPEGLSLRESGKA